MIIELGRVSEETKGPRYTLVNVDGKVFDADRGDFYATSSHTQNKNLI